jgi:hypothetical protein
MIIKQIPGQGDTMHASELIYEYIIGNLTCTRNSFVDYFTK